MTLRKIARKILRKKPSTEDNRRVDKRITFDVGQVVGDGASDFLPYFGSRIYHEVKSIRDFLGDIHVDRSLEIGCGYARLTPWIAEFSNKHFALEPEPKLFEISKELYPTINFVNAPADKIPLPDKYFGLIITWTVLQHIPPEGFEQSIKEILRVARDDALILICEYAIESATSNT